jgi:hypothetical protein
MRSSARTVKSGSPKSPIRTNVFSDRNQCSDVIAFRSVGNGGDIYFASDPVAFGDIPALPNGVLGFRTTVASEDFKTFIEYTTGQAPVETFIINMHICSDSDEPSCAKLLGQSSDGINLRINPVPEPSTILLLALVVVCCLWRLRPRLAHHIRP